MKKQKNAIYYRGLLHKDTIVLLAVAILFAIANIFIVNMTDEAVPTFLKSILFIIFYIILLCNKKENAPFIGILAIVTGVLMIITSLSDGSLFGIVYIILGLFYIIHSIIYLVKLKKDSILLEQYVQKKSKLIYINLGLIFLAMISVVASALFLREDIEILFVILTFASLSFVFVSSVILMIKKYKGALLYITFVISMIFGMLSMIMLTSRLQSIIRDFKYKNSDEFKIDILENLENKLSQDVYILSREGLLIQLSKEQNSYVLIDKTHYEDAISLSLYRKESVYNKEELEGYNCDGYSEVKIDNSEYEQCLVNREMWCDSDLDYTVKTYISCDGKYTYKTEGFDENKLQESKIDDYYKMHIMQDLEYFFRDEVVTYSNWQYLPQPSASLSVIISRKEYELLETTHLTSKSKFKVEKLQGTTCDGYVELTLNENSEIVGKPYISCTGNYNYQTEGFDIKKLLQ